nr:EOG090X084E [Eulimnadia texana]
MPPETEEVSSLLTNFFIFNHEKSFPENEEDKSIVFFFPESASLDIRMKETGRAAAIIKFTRTFDVTNPCKSLHTSKSRQYFYQPEPGYCMVLVSLLNKSYYYQDRKGEANGAEISDLVYHTLLQQSYKMFLSQQGQLTSSLNQGIQGNIRELYLASVPLDNAELSDAFFGVQFLPLDKLLFLKVQSMVHSVEQIFPCIHSSLVLYQEQVIWGGLSQEDMQLVNHYLVTGLLPASAANGLDNRYLTGPTSGKTTSPEVKTPRVFLNYSNAELDECHLIVYRISSVTVCLFVDVSTLLNREFFVSLDGILAPRVAVLATDLAEQMLLHKNQTSALNYGDLRFIYFNQSNLAFKSTLHHTSTTHGRVLQCNSTSAEALKVCADLSQDLKVWNDGDILVKTLNDAWVFSKLNNRRELYVVVTRKNANLSEIYDEVRRVCGSTLNNILLLD